MVLTQQLFVEVGGWVRGGGVGWGGVGWGECGRVTVVVVVSVQRLEQQCKSTFEATVLFATREAI